MKKKSKIPVVVVCPGRGTYTKAELGYLDKYQPKIKGFVDGLDTYLKDRKQPTVSELDGAERFSLRTHTPGEFASTLIYACSAADYQAIDRDKFEVVAITGNSMGWYTALGISGALKGEAAAKLIHTMGSMMTDGVIGGQMIYPVTNELWQRDPAKEQLVANQVIETNKIPNCEVHESIHFGGYAIIGGNEKGLKHMMGALPQIDDRYPFILVNHAAFHTPMMHETSRKAFGTLPLELFSAPEVPLIDGRGKVWMPQSTDLSKLRDYTLGHQVYETYDFSQAVAVALKEFAPEKMVLLGPGATSGGAVGQVMIEQRWKGLGSKAEFQVMQSDEAFLVSMGREDQNALVR